MSVEGNVRSDSERDRTQIRWVLNGAPEIPEPTSGAARGYKLGSRLFDSGGIYEGAHARFAVPFVIKVFWRAAGEDYAMVKAFSREAGRVSILRHPHIAQVLDSGALMDRTPFVAMERLDGQTLEERLNRRGALHASEIVPVIRGIASALSAAHAAGVVHRELRPDNVFLAGCTDDGPGFVKLLDFGVSRLTWTKHAAGLGISVAAARYLAPEQARGDLDEVDSRADQFALAALTYRLLSGADPFPSHSVTTAIVESKLRPIYPSGSGASAIDAVLSKALSERPDGRFPSVDAFFQACEGALTGSASISIRAEDACVSSQSPARVVETEVETKAEMTTSTKIEFDSADTLVPKRRIPLVASLMVMVIVVAVFTAHEAGWRFPQGWRTSSVPFALILLGAKSSQKQLGTEATAHSEARRLAPVTPAVLIAPPIVAGRFFDELGSPTGVTAAMGTASASTTATIVPIPSPAVAGPLPSGGQAHPRLRIATMRQGEKAPFRSHARIPSRQQPNPLDPGDTGLDLQEP